MDKDHIIDLLPEYLDGVLEESQRKKIEGHLEGCPSCTEELEALKTLFVAIQNEKIPVPSERLRTNFLEQLELEKKSVSKAIPIKPKKQKTKNTWATTFLKIAASILLVVGSFLLGRYQQKEKSNLEIAALEDQTLQMKQTAMLSLMENKSASRRIQGVSYIDKFENPDEAIVRALADRMRYDENTNVRLTAVESLRNFTASETVKNAFITALKTEKDPGIQIAIIHTLVEIQEKKAISPLRELMRQETTLPYVKKQIESLLPKII